MKVCETIYLMLKIMKIYYSIWSLLEHIAICYKL